MNPITPFDELWGTFAVDDHTRRHAFVAETILFDRLVIPKPPEDDPEQHATWINEGWQPDLLKTAIGILGKLAVTIPWDENLRNVWAGEYASRFGKRSKLAKNVSFDFQTIRSAPPDHPAMWTTRMVLADRMNTKADEELFRKLKNLDVDPAANIESVVGFGSYQDFRREIPVEGMRMEGPPAPAATIPENAFLFRWDFVVPEDRDATDAKLLERAVVLSQQSEFRESRRRFHNWRRRLIANQVDAQKARDEMSRCLAVCNQVSEQSAKRHRTLTALQVIAAAAPLADFIHPGVGALGGVAFGLGAIVADKLVPEPQIGERERVAALVYDSRAAFGWYS